MATTTSVKERWERCAALDFEHAGVIYEVREFGLVSPLLQRRDPLINDLLPVEEQVQRCTNWLREWSTGRKTRGRLPHSYGLKHRIERDTGGYVSNGALITAAIRLGLGVVPCGVTTPNAWLEVAVPVERAGERG